jgi:hypothetical protein
MAYDIKSAMGFVTGGDNEINGKITLKRHICLTRIDKPPGLAVD